MGAVFSVVLAIGIPLGGGTTIGLLVGPKVNTWYKKLKKPSWNPPGWIFGPVWSVLYTMMGVASWLVYHAKGLAPAPFTLYAIQLALNFAWSPIFFGMKNLKLALADIVGLFGMALATAITFGKASTAAGWLMAPYLGWILFATGLNFKLVLDNPEADKIEEDKLQ